MAKRLAKFDASKHPRGRGGRFTNTPDQPKLSKARVYGTDNSGRKASRKKLSKSQQAKLDEILLERASKRGSSKAGSDNQLSKARVYGSDAESRKLLLSRMSKAQKLRLLAAFEIADKQKVEAEAKAEAEAKTKAKEAEAKTKAKRSKLTPEEKAAKAKLKAEEATLTKPAAAAPVKKVEALRKLLDVNYKDTPGLEYTPKYTLNDEGLPKLPTAGRAHPPAKKSRIDFSDKGLEVWRDQPQYGKMQGKWKDIKNYEYKTKLNGEEVALNKNRLSVEFEGERVYGIPSIHTHLRTTTDQKLFKDMARYMSYVESSGKVPPPSLSWVKTQHGIIYSDQVGYNKKAGEYGVCELHHHEQWTRRKFSDITDKLTYNEKTKRFEDGEISVEEARRQMKELVEPMNEGGKDYLRIKLQDQSDRTVIVLPAGAHNATSKMYEALHPLGISLDGEPKRVKYGIPDTGEFGRETWFNGWNKRFWTEYYRREVYIMRQEIGRRMQKGDISKEQAEQFWQAGIDSVTSTYKYKKYQSDNNTSIRKAIIKDFLDKNDAEPNT